MPEIFYLYGFLLFVAGLFLGYLLAPKTKKNSNSNSKLNNEVLADQVKHLEAKIKTLEKALTIKP